MALRILVAISAALLLLEQPGVQHRALVRIPGAKYVTRLSASPVGSTILAYSTSEEPEGEYVSGNAVLLRLEASRPPVVIPLKLSAFDIDFSPVAWSRDGRKAYVEGMHGIYSVDARTGRFHRLLREAAGGVAVSHDGSRIAYWRLGGAVDDLVVYDLRFRKEIRSWSLEIHYAADRHGYEIAFAPDGKSIYALTYDTEGRMPLKEFLLNSQEVRTISEDCWGLVAVQGNIYFVSATARGKSLMLIVSGTAGEVVADFPYSLLHATGTPRWLVAEDPANRKLGLFHTAEKKVTVLAGHCDDATVLVDGRALYAYHGAVFSDPEACTGP